jgi:hypothetical protein
MTISKCEHGKYLDMCRICFPLPEPSEAINTFAKEMTEAFFPNGQVWIEKPELTLTDEEIEEVMYKCDWAYDPVEFARAILRKAQEK